MNNPAVGEIENIIINDRGFVNKIPQVNTDSICPTLRCEAHGNFAKVMVKSNEIIILGNYM